MDAQMAEFYKIPKVMAEAQMGGELSHVESRIMLALVVRLSSGKSSERISLSEFENMTGAARSRISKALTALHERGWIQRSELHKMVKYSFGSRIAR